MEYFAKNNNVFSQINHNHFTSSNIINLNKSLKTSLTVNGDIIYVKLHFKGQF